LESQQNLEANGLVFVATSVAAILEKEAKYSNASISNSIRFSLEHTGNALVEQ